MRFLISLIALLIASAALAQDAPQAGSAERGAATFKKYMCYTCHGTVGQGADRGTGPKLTPPPPPYPAFVLQVRTPRLDMPAYRKISSAIKSWRTFTLISRRSEHPQRPRTFHCLGSNPDRRSEIRNYRKGVCHTPLSNGFSPVWRSDDQRLDNISTAHLESAGQLPPVFIQIAEDEMRLIAVGFELAEFGDPHRIASGGKVAMSLLNLGFRSQLQSEAIHGR